MANPVQQVVSQDGDFETAGVEDFLKDQSVVEAGVNYQIVAVTGPQSSGKSTLMNILVCCFYPSALQCPFSIHQAALGCF